MAKLPPPPAPRSTRRFAVLESAAFRLAEVDPGAYPRFCERHDGETVHVAISPAAYDYLVRLGESRRDDEILRALPFAEANHESRRRGGGYRLWSTDFALLHGARTAGEVGAWMAKQGVTSRARDVGTLYLPETDDATAVPEGEESAWWIVERGGTTFHLPVGVYRTGRAGSELFQQLLEVVDGEVLRELVVEATAWADEAGRQFADRASPRRRKDELPLTVEALLRALGASWEDAGRLGKIYRPPSSRADLSPYLPLG